MRKRGMVDENENDAEDTSRGEIRGTTYMIGLGTPCIGVITCEIRICTC
jgi:hypothetical protein